MALKPNHFKRYKDIGYLLFKYGQADLVKAPGLSEILLDQTHTATVTVVEPNGADGLNGAQDHDSEAQLATNRKELELAGDLKKLGPSFVLIGQLLAQRPDLLPNFSNGSIISLSEDEKEIPFSAVAKTIEDEIGTPIMTAFRTFEKDPLAVSAIAQSHRAVLKDGKKVIVKIQRPGLTEQIADDMEAFEEITAFIDEQTKVGRRFDFKHVIEELKTNTLSRLDFRQEANNLKIFKEHLHKLEQIVIPTPVAHYSTAKMLTTTMIEGQKITQIKVFGQLQSERCKLAEELFKAYLQQILLDGFVQGNTDPEDVWLTNDGRLALLDLGLVARISRANQDKLMQLFVAINEGRTDDAVGLVISLGNRLADFDETGFKRAVSECILIHRDLPTEQLELGKVLIGIAQAAVKFGISLPSELAMIGTTLISVDHVTRILDPKFDPNAYVHAVVSEMIKQRMIKTFSPAHLFQNVVEATEFIEQLPGRVNRILDAVADNNLKVTVHAIDEQVLISGFQKIANRITLGLILAALIIGASMLMHVPSSFTILGYPGLAMLCFIGAAGGGFILVFEILLSDRRSS
jgi:predicted unusual protein kinase regulating ubiquinone biosynthesis (AarF/ABC1/UbiB family)